MLYKYIFLLLGHCLYFSFSTHKQCICSKSILHDIIAKFSLKSYDHVGFKPGVSVPDANAMYSAPRLQG
jgi:hypothetical protein